MADETENTDEAAPPKRGKAGLILVILGVILAGAGGVAVGYLNLIPGLGEPAVEKVKLPSIENTIFINLPSIVIPLGQNANAKHLRAIFSIETDENYKDRIEKLQPRLMDMLNTYLRAVEEKELTNPERFQNLQAQMLRRARLVSGEDAIKNLLVQEFILQ